MSSTSKPTKQQEARRNAYFLAARLLDNYLDVGQPWSDCADGEPGWFGAHTGEGASTEDCVDCKRLVKQIESLRDQFDDKGKIFPVSQKNARSTWA